MLLTEQEVDALRKSLPAVCKHQDVIRAAESAVLEKLKVQEPFGHYWNYKDIEDGIIVGQYFTNNEVEELGYIPLYRHPLPPADVVRDAERYRWLREVAPNMFWDSHDKEVGFVKFDTKAYLWKPEIFDAAIDNAIGESE